MKTLLVFILIGGIFISCNPDKISESARSEAHARAVRFASEKIDSAVVVTDDNGVVSVGDELARYVIDPKSIFYGEIDEFEGKDILVTIDSLHDPYLMPSWHLVLKEENNQMIVQAAIRSDIRVLSLNNGIITGEVPTHEPSSPLYYCSECRDTLYYRIEGNRLVVSDR